MIKLGKIYWTKYEILIWICEVLQFQQFAIDKTHIIINSEFVASDKLAILAQMPLQLLSKYLTLVSGYG